MRSTIGGTSVPPICAPSRTAAPGWCACWIEIGQDDYSRSFVRALDIGGMVWEGRETYATLDDALQALDTALGAWMKEN